MSPHPFRPGRRAEDVRSGAIRLKAPAKGALEQLVAAAVHADSPADAHAFTQAQQWVNSLVAARRHHLSFSDEAALQLYAAYKQSTCGAAPQAGPSRVNVKERAKWEAWNGMRSLSSEVSTCI